MPPIAERFFGFGNRTAEPAPEVVDTVAPVKEARPSPASNHVTNFECDYDVNPTELYLLLQKKEFARAAQRCASDPSEAKTWVCRKETDGKLRWRLLPLHAAIIFKAPEDIVEALLAAYPKGAESKDDQGMLPLHLAFRNGSSEGVVNLLLVSYPQSIDVKDRKGRIPLVLAQASTSPNKDAFLRALERGPTYYAVAAAATERAAVTAELRAIFDAKLIEIKNQHQKEVDDLKLGAMNGKSSLEEQVFQLETELAKTQETSQVLVDHVNSLEAQLTSRGDTERFLATKIASLDTNLRDVSRTKEESEGFLGAENCHLKNANEAMSESLKEKDEMVNIMSRKIGDFESQISELKTTLGVTQRKSLEEIQKIEEEWATAKANSAILEAQLKKKIETEHSLASQVSSLAGKLAESAAESSNVSVSYASRVESLMEERVALRNTIAELTKKLSFVAKELQKVSSEQDKIVTAASHHESAMSKATKTHEKILANAHHHEIIVNMVNTERVNIFSILEKQEEEIRASEEERLALKEAIKQQEEDAMVTQQERQELLARVNIQKENVRKIVEQDLAIIPEPSKNVDMDEIVDEVVKRANQSTSMSTSQEDDDEEIFSEDPDPVVVEQLEVPVVDVEEQAPVVVEQLEVPVVQEEVIVNAMESAEPAVEEATPEEDTAEEPATEGAVSTEAKEVEEEAAAVEEDEEKPDRLEEARFEAEEFDV